MKTALAIFVLCLAASAQQAAPKPLSDGQKLAAAKYALKLKQAQLEYNSLYNQLLSQVLLQVQSSNQQVELNKALGAYRSMLQNLQKEHGAPSTCDLDDDLNWRCQAQQPEKKQ